MSHKAKEEGVRIRGLWWALCFGGGFFLAFIIFVSSCQPFEGNSNSKGLIFSAYFDAITASLAIGGAALVITNMRLIVLRIGKTETQIEEQKEGNYLSELNAGTGQLHAEGYNEIMGGFMRLHSLAKANANKKTRVKQITEVFLNFIIYCKDRSTPPDDKPPDDKPPDNTPPDNTPPNSTPPDDKPIIVHSVKARILYHMADKESCYYLCRGKEPLYLGEALLQNLNLPWICLKGAILPYANLRRANLIGADLREADLRSAHLAETDLEGADLRGANLMEGVFRSRTGEDGLTKSRLLGTDLRGANLIGIELTEHQLQKIKALDYALVNKRSFLKKAFETNTLIEIDMPYSRVQASTFYIGGKKVEDVDDLIENLKKRLETAKTENATREIEAIPYALSSIDKWIANSPKY